jgi:glutathione synthase/RimK-type ligase-like ATP-grasp enzyme
MFKKMTKKIQILTDYKGFFGSKQYSRIYRGGMDIARIAELLRDYNFEVGILKFSEIEISKIVKEKPIVLYTSQEDRNGFYKSYIEDIIFHLESEGVFVIPRFEYLKAHNNKVAMELLRERSGYKPIQTIQTRVFGTAEEIRNQVDTFAFPVVIKAAAGSMSKGVAKADNSDELWKMSLDVSVSPEMKSDFKDLLRGIKYGRKYVKESTHRNKFIVQNFITGLSNDWKVLVYHNLCYILYRGVRTNDFRASGSGKFVFNKEIPKGILDYAIAIKNHFKVPHISLDIGFDGTKFHLIEFQFINFGTTTIEKSDFWFEKNEDTWLLKEGKSDLEEMYINSIVEFLKEQDQHFTNG